MDSEQRSRCDVSEQRVDNGKRGKGTESRELLDQSLERP